MSAFSTPDDHLLFSMNCSDPMSVLLQPSSNFFLKTLGTGYTIMLIIAICSTAAIFTLGTLHLYCVRNFVSSRSRRTPLYWLLNLFPVSAACLLMGMLMPRVANFLFALAWIYLMVSLYVMVETMKSLFGGRREMSRHLIENNQLISFRVPPCCCCCKCLPTMVPTEKNLRKIEWLILQTVVVRIVLMIFSIIIISEMIDNIQTAIKIITYLAIVQNISMMFAIFGCHTLATLAKEKLAPFRFVALFRILDGTMGLFGLLQLICDQLINFKVFSCGPFLSPQAKANYWFAFVLICLILLMSSLTTFLFLPKKTAIFDRHPSRQTDRQSEEKHEIPTDTQEERLA